MIKKVTVEGWPNELTYIEGQVTADDIIVDEIEEDKSYDETRNGGVHNIGWRKLHMKTEVAEVLGYDGACRCGYSDYSNTHGVITLKIDEWASTYSDRGITMMKNRYDKRRGPELEGAVAAAVAKVVDWANRDIERSKAEAARTIAQNVINFKWDAQDEIDVIDEDVKKLREKISVLNDKRRKIVVRELKGWMTKEKLPKDVKDQILKEACLDKRKKMFLS